ncbi:type 1 glutamine amidotransferase [Irregularibacter muris]|uniref:Type 1 glutamine amidotransferase n=1 Tax=Irregularibacter muris TaxID=1796619 RepID=A0AAE3HDU5_9FIRM|nr:type 1 glutamine amidotransferase domain-containing protein [Irregularibacter muris]MCR1897577.1 type 1 glutamine amidotransferase [Irregularibacter muris]
MKLEGLKIIALVHDEFEDLELTYPMYRLREEGIVVHLVGEEAQKQYLGKYGVPVVTDFAFRDINPSDYDGLVIPGGWAPDKLRRDSKVLEITRHMHENDKPIAQICHAGWVLVSANTLKGKKVTSTVAIKDDMENAGAIWVDEEVVVDGTLVSSRRPLDLPIYMKTYVDVLKQARK